MEAQTHKVGSTANNYASEVQKNKLMGSPGISHNRNASMVYEGPPNEDSGKKQVAKKNLSKFIKPYTKTEKAKLSTGQSIVVGM